MNKVEELIWLSDATNKVLGSWKILAENVQTLNSLDWDPGDTLLKRASVRITEFQDWAREAAYHDRAVEYPWKIKDGNFSFRDEDIGCPFFYTMQSDGEVRGPVPVFRVCNTEQGGFDQYFSHVLPALFMNQLLPSLSSHSDCLVETHVVCIGNKTSSNKFMHWWGHVIPPHRFDYYAWYIARHILASTAFHKAMEHVHRKFVDVEPKPVRRVCVWLKLRGHVCMLVFELTATERTCFSVDTLPADAFTAAILKAFVKCVGDQWSTKAILKEFFEREGRTWSEVKLPPALAPKISVEHIPLAEDMTCVSFMARCTIYLSMVNSSKQKASVHQFSQAVGMISERAAYDEFENSLFNFIRDALAGGKTVWLSPMNASFVNINDIYLVRVDRAMAHLPEGREAFVYAGNGKFVKRTNCDGDVDSVTAAPPPPTGVFVKNGCAICAVAECSVLLERLRLRKINNN
jgi:hypothetical protein